MKNILNLFNEYVEKHAIKLENITSSLKLVSNTGKTKYTYNNSKELMDKFRG